MADQPHLLQESFARVEHVADKVALHFYSRLFVENPELRDLFPLMMDVQRSRLLRALVRVVQGLDSPGRLDRYLRQLGHDHRKFGVRPAHYDAVGRALVAALREYSGAWWTPAVEEAWASAYATLAERMIAGAAASARSPAWWVGTVVAHERVSRDVALVAVRPDRPYPYQPGQYVSLETPHRPRLWRTYSIANAPHPDGLLRFQVRAVDGGWVSAALVCRVAVGDELRLGPPMGSLRVDRHCARPLVFVAGGTGLAPCAAMIEDMARWNTRRDVHLFHGVRRAGDLWAAPLLRGLADRCPWLTVVTAVSHDPGWPGPRGRVADVAAEYRPWRDATVVVSGSPGMIRSTLGRFRARGVPAGDLHFDPFGDG